MDFQVGFNILVGISGFLCAYILLGNKGEHEELKKCHGDISKKIQEVEVSMARDYATNIRLEQIGRDIFAMLHRIEDKMDKKVDK